MGDMNGLLSAEEQRQIVGLVAQRALHVAAPEELAIFDETAAEYFADPAKATTADRRDEAIGFGLDLAMVTPYLLSMATVTVGVLGQMVRQAVTEQGAAALGSVIRRVLHIGGQDATVPPLTADQARQLRQVAVERGLVLGLDASRAATLADAVVGGMLTS
jgi:hypothetical protein